MSAVKELTDDTFADEIKSGVALVDFWAPWCGPCRMQGPIVEEVAGDLGDRATVAKLEVDANPQAAAKFSVQSIPTLVIFKDGAEAERFVGVQNKAALTEALEKHLAG